MRPLPITILCIVLFIAGGLGIIGIVVSFSNFSIGRLLWVFITTSLSFISTLALWKMKRWGVYLYLGGYIIGTITFYLFPPVGSEILDNKFLLLAVPLIYSAVIFPYWKRLR